MDGYGPQTSRYDKSEKIFVTVNTAAQGKAQHISPHTQFWVNIVDFIIDIRPLQRHQDADRFNIYPIIMKNDYHPQ